MLTGLVLLSAAMLGILTTTVFHLPPWLRKAINWLPAWLQAGLIHFAYGGWVGGVTGHLVGGMVSVPWFFIARYWLRPRIQPGS